jgi:Glycosyl hydrolases family 43
VKLYGAFALTTLLALTGGPSQPSGFDFGDPSLPSTLTPGRIQVFTTGGEVLTWAAGPKDSPLKPLLEGTAPTHKRLRVEHADGTPFDEAAGEDIWDPTLEVSLENPKKHVLYAGAMKPKPSAKVAVWPEDNWRRRTFAFTEINGAWRMAEKPLFDNPTDDIEAGTWVGHNYGHAFLKSDSGALYVFYERVTEERFGHPWKTEIFARLMKTSLTADSKEIKILSLPKKAWPATKRSFGGSLIEGPRPFKALGYYFISFSAGDYNSDSYGIHLAWAKSLDGPYTPYLNASSTDLFDFSSQLEVSSPFTWGAGRAAIFEEGGSWYALFHGIKPADLKGPDGLRNIYLSPLKIAPGRSGRPPTIEFLPGSSDSTH